MRPSYLIEFGEHSRPQADIDTSFVGGLPSLPPDEPLPLCSLCGADQTFFFQVAFPADQLWKLNTVAVFACTACADESLLIPEMLESRLQGAIIPEGFLTSYQRNFRFVVFKTEEGVLRWEYVPRVRFSRLRLEATTDSAAPQTKIGGRPTWLLEDEAPGTYADDTGMGFLMQLAPGTCFDTVEGAPRQAELGLDGKPRTARRDHYELFLGNATYMFGTKDPELRLVYTITQID